MATSLIRALVVDDYEPWRHFVTATLRKRPQIRVIAEVSDGSQAVQQAEQLQPDLIVLDIGLPTLNGVEAARQIRRLSPSSKIIFLSENRSSDIVEEAIRTGASGYVFKSDAASALLPAVEAVLQGKQFLNAGLDDYDRTARDHIPGKIVTMQQSYNADARIRHPIDFYAGDSAFVDAFSDYIETALANGRVAVMIASEAHHASIRQRLRSSGVDVDAVVERKYYIPLDLADPLSRVEGTSDTERLATSADFRTLEEIGAAEQRQLDVAVG